MLEQAFDPALYQSTGGFVAMNEASRYVGNWQEVLAARDPQMVWERLYDLVEKVLDDDEDLRCMKTQQLFLQLLGEGRINCYVEGDLTDEEIEEDLISQLAIL